MQYWYHAPVLVLRQVGTGTLPRRAQTREHLSRSRDGIPVPLSGIGTQHFKIYSLEVLVEVFTLACWLSRIPEIAQNTIRTLGPYDLLKFSVLHSPPLHAPSPTKKRPKKEKKMAVLRLRRKTCNKNYDFEDDQNIPSINDKWLNDWYPRSQVRILCFPSSSFLNKIWHKFFKPYFM